MFLTVYVTIDEFKKAKSGIEFWGRVTPLSNFIVTLQVPVSARVNVVGEAVQVLP